MQQQKMKISSWIENWSKKIDEIIKCRVYVYVCLFVYVWVCETEVHRIFWNGIVSDNLCYFHNSIQPILLGMYS